MSTSLAKNLRADRIDALPLRPLFAVAVETSVADAVAGMTEHRVGCALVNDGAGRLAGTFTERDFLRRVVAAGLDAATVPVGTVMSAAPPTLARGASVAEAVELLAGGESRHVAVTGDDGRAVGVLSVKDLLHYLAGYFPAKVYNLSPSTDQTQPAREGA